MSLFPFSIAIILLITKNKKKRTTIISKNCFGSFQTFRYRYPRIKKKKKAAIVSKGFEINKFDLMDFNACISISIAVATYSTNKKRESGKQQKEHDCFEELIITCDRDKYVGEKGMIGKR